MLDASGQPTPRARAYTVRELLIAQLERLREVPLDLMQHASTREATRADAIAVAIEHLQAAIDALELAGQE
jgi:hypothetical protein